MEHCKTHGDDFRLWRRTPQCRPVKILAEYEAAATTSLTSTICSRVLEHQLLFRWAAVRFPGGFWLQRRLRFGITNHSNDEALYRPYDEDLADYVGQWIVVNSVIGLVYLNALDLWYDPARASIPA